MDTPCHPNMANVISTLIKEPRSENLSLHVKCGRLNDEKVEVTKTFMLCLDVQHWVLELN
jgi:hypothetical protein